METNDSLHYVSDVLGGVDEEDRGNIMRFALYLEDWVRTHGLNERYNIFTLLDNFHVYDLSTLNKEGSCLQALWVIFLRIMRKNLVDDSLFKYKTMTEFLSEYNGDFDKCDPNEQIKLFHTANWMTILFKMVPAKKNKGLAIHVIPKLVEGFSVKYITGSGQTKATADRVHIFEHEGNVKPFQRGKWKNNDEMKKSTPPNGAPEAPPKKPKKERQSAEGNSFKRYKSEKVVPEVKDLGPVESFGRDRSIDSVDFAECLKLLRSNSQTVNKTLDGVDASGFERNKSIDSVDFAECLKLLRGSSYSRPPELSRDWSNTSLGFLTDSLLQPLASESYPAFGFERCEPSDGLSLLNEAANASVAGHLSSLEYASIIDSTPSGEIDLSGYNQLASAPLPAPLPMKRSSSLSSSWNAANSGSPGSLAGPGGGSLSAHEAGNNPI